MMYNSSLLSTERNLTNLFVGGVVLFLVLFESVFVVSRVISERRFEETQFREETDRMIQAMSRRGGESLPRFGGRQRIDVNVVLLNASGIVSLSNSGIFFSSGDLDEREFIVSLQNGDIAKYEDRLYRKFMNQGGEALLFFRNSSYAWQDITRDILRFLILDLIILIPLWFMSRRVVRQTLTPIEESMDAMSHFVHDAGHELKTPLSVVSGNLQILRDFPEKGEKLIKTSIETIHTMGQSIDGLLELANISRPHGVKNIPLKKTLEEEILLLEDIREGKGITILSDVPINKSIMIDRRHFHLLMKNLLENAIKYNVEGGKIFITLRQHTLEVRDTGKGIIQEEREKIFGRFYRIEKNTTNGTGIGLAIVDRITKIYGWRCEVESEEGKGSTFRIVMRE